MVVLLTDTKYHKILRTFSLHSFKDYCSFEKLYPKLNSVFHPTSRHLEVGLKNLGCDSLLNSFLVSKLTDW